MDTMLLVVTVVSLAVAAVSTTVAWQVTHAERRRRAARVAALAGRGARRSAMPHAVSALARRSPRRWPPPTARAHVDARSCPYRGAARTDVAELRLPWALCRATVGVRERPDVSSGCWRRRRPSSRWSWSFPRRSSSLGSRAVGPPAAPTARHRSSSWRLPQPHRAAGSRCRAWCATRRPADAVRQARGRGARLRSRPAS